jgi:hypothetical protein
MGKPPLKKLLVSKRSQPALEAFFKILIDHFGGNLRIFGKKSNSPPKPFNFLLFTFSRPRLHYP